MSPKCPITIPGTQGDPGMADRRIGLIGDVHAEDRRLGTTINFLMRKGVDSILCTGDIVDGTGDPESCIRMLDDNNIHVVKGNHDRWCLEGKARHIPNAHLRSDLACSSLEYLAGLPKQVTINTVAGPLLLCHGIGSNDLRKVWPGTERMPIERSQELDTIIATNRHRFVVNGHMHFKTIIHFATLKLINAGTITGNRWPGFTLIDFDTRTIDTYRFQDELICHGKSTSMEDEPEHLFIDTQDFAGNWEPQLLFHMPRD